MATVYLPMGYPQISGEEFQNVIYQGNAVRLYTVPTDPRTDAQLQNRRLLADISKIRGNLGLWGKKALRSGLGPRWGTVIWQAVKADVEGWWSAALDEWDGFNTSNKNAWRNACPYQATYNDVGQMFFATARVIYHALLHYSGIDWTAVEWGATQSAAAAAWWAKDLTNVMIKGWYHAEDAYFTKVGTWQTYSDAGAIGGQFLKGTGSSGQYLHFYYYGRYFNLIYQIGPDYGDLNVWVDGVLEIELSQYYGSVVNQQLRQVIIDYKGLHYCKLIKETLGVTLDSVQVT